MESLMQMASQMREHSLIFICSAEKNNIESHLTNSGKISYFIFPFFISSKSFLGNPG